MLHDLVVGHRIAVDDQMRLRIEGFAHGHIAFHESDQSGIVQPPQAGTFPASVGAQAAGASTVQEKNGKKVIT